MDGRGSVDKIEDHYRVFGYHGLGGSHGDNAHAVAIPLPAGTHPVNPDFRRGRHARPRHNQNLELALGSGNR
jgi:hypothetical protein